MTTVWGPLGWITLHSVATSYPDRPTDAEQTLMYSWLDKFRDTITCSYCRGHFTELLGRYRTLFPNMLSSRQEFAVFTFRAHNAVNARLLKPVYSSIDECMSTLRKATEHTSARDFRVSYINHIMRNWRSFQDISGISAVKKILEMQKVEMEYIASRDTKFQVALTPDVVILPSGALTAAPEPGTRPRFNPQLAPAQPRFRITGGGIRIQR